jgi:ATP-dependent helicase/nuclease subunit A
MSKTGLQDQQARHAIRTELDRTFLVEAGAGSGKTSSLVERMVALITGGRCLPENMAAVTFTRKAAGELRERFQDKLEKALREATDEDLRQCLSAALARLDRAFLGTIHSFCARLLRERPVEAGMTPDFTEIEGMEEALLQERAWAEYLTRVRLLQPEMLHELDRLDLSPGDLKDAFRELSLYPDVQMAVTPAACPDLSPARAKLEELCLRAGRCLPEKEPEKGWDGLQRLCRLVQHRSRVFDLDDDRHFLRLLARMDKEAKPTLNRWPCKDDAKEMAADFQAFRNHFVRPALRQWREYRHKTLMDFLLPAVDTYQALREKENKVNFQDLLMRTARLLKENIEVREYFQQRYTHLLVDEFQDTDPIQAEIMLYLTGTDTAGQEWTRLSPRPGALFVVGDPKQSIYRFRRADIDTYNCVREIIEQSGGEVLRLTANFRSLPAVIDFANAAFAEILQENPPYQAHFEPMQHIRVPVPGTTGGIFRLLVEARGNQEDIVREDAHQAASWLRHCLDSELRLSRTPDEEEAGISPAASEKDFMILVRYKKHMAVYARALEECGIPYTLSGGGDIAASQELWELLFLLQAIADPDNPVALVATLRGLFFGISDDLLYRFKQAGGHFSFLAGAPGSDPDVSRAFTPAWEQLCLYHRWSLSLPPSSALEKMITDLGLLPYALSGSMGKGRAGHVLQAVEMLRGWEKSGLSGFADAVSFLELLLNTGLEDELDIEGGRSPGVRIMNLHRAKGLEAPVVILANPGKTTTHQPTLHVRRTAGIPRGYIRIQQRRNDFAVETLAQPVGWDAHAAEETSYQQAEEMRLLYVAATRAKNIMVVSTYTPKPEKSPWYLLEKYLLDMEVLARPDLPPIPREEREPIIPALLQSARDEISAGIARVIAPTYRHQTVTQRAGEKAPSREYTGRGLSWGNIIHRALEVLVKEEENVHLNNMVHALVCAEGRPRQECEQVHDVLRSVMSTPFWQRVRQASEKYAEIPFGLREGDSYLTGIVDLAFKEKTGWVLVDYKTDTIRDDDHLWELVHYYSPQVREYARRWEQLSGEKVAEYGLFFVSILKYHVIQ